MKAGVQCHGAKSAESASSSSIGVQLSFLLKGDGGGPNPTTADGGLMRRDLYKPLPGQDEKAPYAEMVLTAHHGLTEGSMSGASSCRRFRVLSPLDNVSWKQEVPTPPEITFVHVTCKPECLESFEEATEMNASHSRKEEDNVRFDFLQDVEDTNRYLLIEMYATNEGPKVHKTTSHYLTWRETVAEMMLEPRMAVSYHLLSSTAP